MIKVVLFGSGNLGTHLTREFLNSDAIELVQVYSRNINKIQYLKEKTAITDNINQLKEADIYIISISDNAISSFSQQLFLKNKLVVHTSGSVAMKELNRDFCKGVFYPLQTFSKNKKLDFKQIPICVESERKEDLSILKNLASKISDNVYLIDSNKRKKLHLAAVFVNNFVNHLYHIGSEVCEKNNLPFEILQPLILETANKVQNLTPKDAQTGPGKRNDTNTIDKQISQLKSNQKKIYKILTASIIKTYQS